MERESRRPSIVVIDNSERVLAVTRAELESAGYRVATHPRAAGAVALILQEKPDLVLLEVTTGGDSIAKLFGKAQPNGSTIVLLYSALSAEALAAKAAACGAHGYIRKTPDGMDFLRQIKSWLNKAPASSGRMKTAPRVDVDEERARPSANRLRISPTSSTASIASPAGVVSPASTGSTASAGSTAWPSSDSNAMSDPPRASGTMLIDERVVLFIDDDMETLSNFRREVQRESYTAEFALSGARGLSRILAPAPPDLVLCDLTLQDMDGPSVYRAALASDPRWRTRFMFLSDTFVRRARLELFGFDGTVLEKPISGQALRATIQRALSAQNAVAASGRG